MSIGTMCETRRICIVEVGDAFGWTRHITCRDGTRLTIDTMAGVRGDIKEAMPHLSPGCEARVMVDEAGRIQGVAHPDARIHPVTLQLLEALEVDVAATMAWGASALLWSTAKLTPVECPDGSLVDLEGEVVLMVGYEGFTVAHHDISIQTKLPETTAAACEGRLLREVVSIPDLDHLDIRILHAERTPIGTMFTIVPQEGATALHVS